MTNEIPMFSTLLDRIEIAGAVITADALRYHARRPSRPLQTIMKCQTTLLGHGYTPMLGKGALDSQTHLRRACQPAAGSSRK